MKLNLKNIEGIHKVTDATFKIDNKSFCLGKASDGVMGLFIKKNGHGLICEVDEVEQNVICFEYDGIHYIGLFVAESWVIKRIYSRLNHVLNEAVIDSKETDEVIAAFSKNQ